MTNDCLRRLELAAECGRWKGSVELALMLLSAGDVPHAVRVLQDRLAEETS
jgi:hypothetical protein